MSEQQEIGAVVDVRCPSFHHAIRSGVVNSAHPTMLSTPLSATQCAHFAAPPTQQGERRECGQKRARGRPMARASRACKALHVSAREADIVIALDGFRGVVEVLSLPANNDGHDFVVVLDPYSPE